VYFKSHRTCKNPIKRKITISDERHGVTCDKESLGRVLWTQKELKTNTGKEMGSSQR
jgi:hypothetical protein